MVCPGCDISSVQLVEASVGPVNAGCSTKSTTSSHNSRTNQELWTIRGIPGTTKLSSMDRAQVGCVIHSVFVTQTVAKWFHFCRRARAVAATVGGLDA